MSDGEEAADNRNDSDLRSANGCEDPTGDRQNDQAPGCDAAVRDTRSEVKAARSHAVQGGSGALPGKL